MDKVQIKRVRNELKAAGVGPIGLHLPESKELAKLLEPDEHIGGAIYGRYSRGFAWLIATDQRVIFMDKKPFFTTTDELTYDVVAGVKSSRAGLFYSVVLHTRVADYSIRFVNAKRANTFVRFVETRQLESHKTDQPAGQGFYDDKQLPVFQNVSEEALFFLKEHDLAVLSTIDRTGNVHGAVVYYLIDQNNYIYILTKSETDKGRNIYAHSQIALTVYEPGTTQTVQLRGLAEVETNPEIKTSVLEEIIKPRSYKGEMQSPPVTKLREGSFMVIRITPGFTSFHDYAKVS